MTDTAKHLLKKYAVLLGIFLVFFGLFFSLTYLKKRSDQKYLTAAADTLCRLYPGFKERIAITGIIETALPGLSFRTVLSASYMGRDAFVFLLPVTGKFGVYPAVFFYERSIGCVFCGLAGVNAAPERIEKYGITAAAVNFRKAKIEALMKEQTR